MARLATPRSGRREGQRWSASPMDSPSRQLLRDLEQLQLHEMEMNKVAAYNRRSFYEELDQRQLEQALSDTAELDTLVAKREAVRREAEAVLQAHIRDEEEKAEQKRQEKARQEAEIAAAKKAAEEKTKAEAEAAERKKKEEIERRQCAERAAAEKKAKEEADRAAAAAKKEADEKAAKDASEVKKKAEEEAAAKAEAAKKAVEAQQQPKPLPLPQPASQPDTTTSQNEAIHARYLEIHKRLKTFRAEFWKAAKADPNLKSQVGDMRRAIRTTIGQLTDSKTKGANRPQSDRVRAVLQQALTLPSPPVDVREFLVEPLPASTTDFNIPSLLIYILNIFSKAVCSQFAQEAAVSSALAEPAGILTAQVFAQENTHFRPAPPHPPVPLISILLAKLHAACPVLFGISPLPKTLATTAAKLRLGWRREPSDSPSGPPKAFVSDTRHYERVSGLATGYTAIALRNFSKAKAANPYPPKHFWTSLASLTATPHDRLTATHLVVLRAMLEHASERVVLLFGDHGVAALRWALVEWPRTLPGELRDGVAGKALVLLAEEWGREVNFHLV